MTPLKTIHQGACGSNGIRLSLSKVFKHNYECLQPVNVELSQGCQADV